MGLVARLFTAMTLLVAATVTVLAVAGGLPPRLLLLATLGGVAAAAAAARLLGRALARPLAGLATAARAVASGDTPEFPETRIPELARLVAALRETARQLADRLAALRREREEAAAVIDSLADGVIATDPRGEIVTANAAARRLLGYGPGAPLPPLGELFHDKRARDFVRAAFGGRELEPRELPLEDRTVVASARPLPDRGTALVLRDVTALRRLEAVRRDFVANVSHELKTPLTSITGYAETLAHEASGQARRFAETIVQNARRMQRLVDGLLDLSRIESGTWRPAPRLVPLDTAARDAWAPLADRAREGGVRFETAIAPEAHVVAADPDALRQVLTNLLDNAVRHTPPGGLIRVTGEVAHDSVAVAVHDTGSGIPSEHLPRVFERFYRVDPARSRDRGGSGLGLAIVKHLVEAHGGSVEAESAVGRGTTVRAYFPAQPAPG